MATTSAGSAGNGRRLAREIALLLEAKGPRPHVVIAMGKGGVGKTTVSIMLGIVLAEAGARVLVASLDPAQHLLEYLGLPGTGREYRVDGGLWAVQYDIDDAARKLAEDYALTVKRVMPGLATLNIDDVVEALRDAPGFEEEVFLRLLDQLYSKTGYDYVVVDTPPTGIALRVLRLPSLYRFWLDQLTRIRERIVALRYTISRVLGKKPQIHDPVLEKLYQLRDKYEELAQSLRSRERTSIVIVATPEPLPVYEAETVVAKLAPIGISPRLIVLNRYLGSRASELGVERVEKEALERLEKLRCSIEAKPPLVVIAHAGYAPRSLEDARRLLGHIAFVNKACQQ